MTVWLPRKQFALRPRKTAIFFFEQDEQGDRPLFAAIRHGNHSATEYLLQIDYLIGQEDQDGNSLLHWAVIQNQPKLIPQLWKKGVSIDGRRKSDDLTPLMLAAKFNNAPLVKQLLDCGASAYLIDASGKNAADIALAAQTHDDDEVLDFFSAHGPDDPDEIDGFMDYEKVQELLVIEEETGPIAAKPVSFFGRFKESLAGLQFFVAGCAFMGIGISQAVTGWISDTVFARVLYCVLCTLIGLPLAAAGIFWAFAVWFPDKKK